MNYPDVSVTTADTFCDCDLNVVAIAQLIAVYLHVYNFLVITIECRSALYTIILMGGAAASETLIGGYM